MENYLTNDETSVTGRELVKKLKAKRLVTEMTQKTLSEKTGISVYKLSLIENGERSLTIDEAAMIGQALGVVVKWYLEVE